MQIFGLKVSCVAVGMAVLTGTVAQAEEFRLPWLNTPATFYGQINMGVLSFDDGGARETYAPVDNANSGTRFGFIGNHTLANGGSIGGLLEIGLTPNSTGTVSILDPNDGGYRFDKNALRHLDFHYKSDGFGRIWLGQGSMASDGIAGLDFSGTGVVAGSAVADLAGGQIFRLSDGSLSTVKIGDVYSNMGGSRRLRLRYNTPNLNGFIFGASYGQNALSDTDDNDYSDVTVNYVRDTGDIKLAGGLAYSWNGANPEKLAGSLAILHKSSGMSVALAGGRDEADAQYYFVKAGWEYGLWAVGNTAVSLDYYDGTGLNGPGSSSQSVGLALVQKFDDIKLEAYAALRNHSYDDTLAQYQDGRAVLAGMRWKF